MACNCPEGYELTQDGSECIQITQVAATPPPDGYYLLEKGLTDPQYGLLGTRFYEDITNKPFPLTHYTSGTLLKDATNVDVAVPVTVVSPLWGDGTFIPVFGPNGYGYTGRLNKVGVGYSPNTQDCLEVNFKWIGNTVCIDVPETATYCFGIGSDDDYRIFVDGQLIVEASIVLGSDKFGYNYWHVFPFELSAGFHIIRFEGRDKLACGGYGAEIYKATAGELAAMTTIAEVEAVRVYTTWDGTPQNAYTGSDPNHSATCPEGYIIGTCDGAPACYQISRQEALPCCYILNSCEVGITPILTSTDLSAYVGQIITVEEYPDVCWQIQATEFYNCNEAVPVTLVETHVTCQECLAPDTCYKLTDCTNPQNVLYTAVDLSANVGDVVSLTGYPDLCWTVENSTECGNLTSVALDEVYPSCSACTLQHYLLTECAPGVTTIITSTDLSANVGQVIQIEGQQGKCFTVSETELYENAVEVQVNYSYETCEECIQICYVLTPCEEGLPTIKVTNDLSAWVGSTIRLCPENLPTEFPIPEQTGFAIRGGVQNGANSPGTLTPCCPGYEPVYTNNNSLVSYDGLTLFIPSLDPKICWVYTVGAPESGTFIDLTGASGYVDCPACQAVNSCEPIPVLENCECYEVAQADDCFNSLTLPNLDGINTYDSCEECLSKCYLLTNCEDNTDTLLVNTNLEAYVGQTIKLLDICPDKCWTVSEVESCVGSISISTTLEVYASCELCLPPVEEPAPKDLIRRAVRPGFYTPACPPEYVVKVNCNFSEQVYNAMVQKRYGIKNCCEDDTLKWKIKKMELDLKSLYDPSLCVSSIVQCCPPQCVTAELEVFQTGSCAEPQNINSVIVIPV